MKTLEEFEDFLLSALKNPNTIEPIKDFYDDIDFFDSDLEFEDNLPKKIVLEDGSLGLDINFLHV